MIVFDRTNLWRKRVNKTQSLLEIFKQPTQKSWSFVLTHNNIIWLILFAIINIYYLIFLQALQGIITLETSG